MRPVLLTVAHGTRDGAGNPVARQLTARAAVRLGMRGVTGYVELQQPLFGEALAELGSERVVAVPLLLSVGHHVRHDLPASLAATPWVGLAGPLGPDPRLALAQVERLLRAGAQPGCRVVLVAAGSRDPDAARDVRTQAGHLARLWGGPVVASALAGPLPRPADVLRPGDAVSPYLLAEGHFARRVREECAGTDPVAEVLGAHPAVVDVVVARAQRAVATGWHAPASA